MRQKPPFSKCCEIVTRQLDTSQPSCRARRLAAARMCATDTATSSAISSAVKLLLISNLSFSPKQRYALVDFMHRPSGRDQINQFIRDHKLLGVKPSF